MANFDKLSLYIQQLDSILYSKKIERPVIVSSNTKQIPILMYHRVEEFDKLPKFLKTPTRKDISLNPDDFYKQMDKIKAAGYKTVTMKQIGEATAKGDKEFFNGKKIVLTFDDGYTEHFKIVFPKLKELGFVGTFGVISSYQGTNGYIDWNMIREMSQNQMEIVSDCCHVGFIAALCCDGCRVVHDRKWLRKGKGLVCFLNRHNELERSFLSCIKDKNCRWIT